jgi:hypothetical protein
LEGAAHPAAAQRKERMHHAIKRSLILPQGAWRSDGADLYGGHFLSLVQQLDIQLLVVTFLVSLMLLVFTITCNGTCSTLEQPAKSPHC